MGHRIDYPHIGVRMTIDTSGDFDSLFYKFPSDPESVSLRDAPHWLTLAAESLSAAGDIIEALEQDIRNLERARSDLEGEIDDLRCRLAEGGES